MWMNYGNKVVSLYSYCHVPQLQADKHW